MGEKEEVGYIGECGVGSIVWVRRRNGSWWPGKILRNAELVASHLPRSGTPVKLLGREDASVDWYNLEKSKRVKPFRCGEFNECIERAESALGMPPKKREKYARREDAILHALELEKQLMDGKYGNLGSPIDGYCNKSSDAVKKEIVASSKCSNYGGKDVNVKPGSKRFILSTEDVDTKGSIRIPEVNEASQMGGDLGLRSSPSKQKLSPFTSLNGSRKLELENFDQDLPISGLVDEFTNIPRIQSSLDKKRKPPNDVLRNEPLVKRRDRRRTLVQVLQKSEKLPSKSSSELSEEDHVEPTNHAKMRGFYLPNNPNDCSDEDKLVTPIQMAKSPSRIEINVFPCPTPLYEQSASESTETDSSKTHSMDSEEDDEMVVGLAEPAFVPELESKSLEISGQLRHGSSSSELPNDNDMSHLYPHDLVPPPSLGASKWQIKGKRNNRSLTRRSKEATDRWVARRSMYTTVIGNVESDSFDETDKFERNFNSQNSPYYNKGYLSTPKASFKGYNDVSYNLIDWEDLAWNEQPLMRGYWDKRDPTFGYHRFGGRMKSGLVDVDLKVQSSYQKEHVPLICKLNGKGIVGHPIQVDLKVQSNYRREHVPMISLMSKLNGRAIVGHPIQVEILENGFTDSLLSSADCIDLEILNSDTAVPAGWTTARRFASSQAPRSESVKQFQNGNHNKKGHFRKLALEKISKKTPKKMSLSSNQKIRNLSTIGREQRFSHNLRSGNKESFRLIRGEAGATTVACIPVKLVFCRLNEELVGRHQ